MTTTTLHPPQPSPATTTPPMVFIFCVEAGGFEPMSLRAVASLRKFGGRFADCPVVAVTPRRGPALAKSTLRGYESLGVQYLSIRPPNPYAWSSMLNKPLAMLAVAEKTSPDQICFVDSDMIFMAEPTLLQLDDQTGFTACAPDKNMGTSGEADENTPYWKEVCKTLGMDLNDIPWVRAHRENVDIRLYFNSGIFCTRKGNGFLEEYQRCVLKMMEAKLSSKISGVYFRDQETLGLAVVKQHIPWKPLPHSYNYAVGRKIMDKYEPEKVRHGIVLHYHDMMWPENWATLLFKLQIDRPEIHDWLQPQGPLKLEGSFIQKTYGKLLKSYRSKKLKQYRHGCRMV
jgi:hypothetical protein